MSLSTELIETIVALAPGLAAVALLILKTRAIRGWGLKVLSAAVLAVVGLGLLLKRLTSACPDNPPTCQAAESPIPRVPGIISQCYQCGSTQEQSKLAGFLNEAALQIQAGSALVCVLASLFITVTFLLWARKQLK